MKTTNSTGEIESKRPPVRVTLSRRKGWRMPPNTIKVCRPGLWGNPFNVDGERTTEQAVIMYESWLGSADWDSWLWSKHRKHWLRTQNAECRLPALLHELRGKNLACWCGQKSPCHAAVLLRLANGMDQGLRTPASDNLTKLL